MPHSKTQKKMRVMGDVMANLGKLADKKQIKVRVAMVPFFMLLSKSYQRCNDNGQPCQALEAHCFPFNANPVDRRRVYKLMTLVISLDQIKGNFYQQWRRTR